jgi:hypothetical protein
MARRLVEDDVVIIARRIKGLNVKKDDRWIMICSNCKNQYSTSIQNERKKENKWICNHCVLARPRSKETRLKMKEAALQPERRHKNIERNSGCNNSFFGKKHTTEAISKMRGRKWTKEARDKFSKKIAEKIANGYCNVYRPNKQWFISKKTGEANYADSGYELKRMIFLDACEDVKSWTKKHGIVLRYGFDQRRYIPDFLIELNDKTKVLQEIKGWVRDKEEFHLKNEAAKNYCLMTGMTFELIFGDKLQTIRGDKV